MKEQHEELMGGQRRDSAVLRLLIVISITLHAALCAVIFYKGTDKKPDTVIEIIAVDMNEPPPPPVSTRKPESARITPQKSVAEQKPPPPTDKLPLPVKTASQPVKESVPVPTDTMTTASKQVIVQTVASPPPATVAVKPRLEAYQPVATAAQDEQKIGQEREYGRIIRSVIEKHKEYPPTARKSGTEGIVIVKFVLSCEGELKSAALHRSCGRGVLDNAALNTVKGIKRFPSYPDKNRRADLSFELPIAYKISSER